MISRFNDSTRFGLADLLLLLTIILWGINMSVLKIGLRLISPHAFNAIRLSLAVLVYAAILMLIPGKFSLGKGDGWKTIGLGFLGITAYQLFFIQALSQMSASSTAIVMGTSPVFIALLSTALGQEKIHWAGWVGVVLSFSGFLLVVAGINSKFSWSGTKGALQILAANACWACYTVFSKPVLDRNSALKISALATISGTLIYLPFAAPELVRVSWHEISGLTWAAIFYSGLVAISLCFFLWYVALKAVGSAKTGAYGNLSPIFAALFAALILGERLTARQGLGALMILIGVYLTRSGYRFFVSRVNHK